MTRVAVDIGGTFTDLVHLDEATGAVGLAKASTTPARFEDGVLDAVAEANVEGVTFLAHGSTVIINALTERKGARTALITTRGFRDVLEIGKSNRPDLYNLLYRKPVPFVRRSLRLEVTERIDYRGRVLVELDENDVRAAVAEARAQEAEAIAVCFLHAYCNPEHERRAIEIVRAEWPEVAITASYELTNEWREYERTSTTVLDAYVKPVASRYLAALADRLVDAGIERSACYCMLSNGGVSRFEVVARAPIELVESGPVGGIIGAAAIGSAISEPNLITLDIGGTTAKCSLVENGEVRLTGDYHIERTPATAGYPIKVPVVDIVEIGAGGGSIAWIDPAGSLRIGPESAGADPGPACYGRGDRPTVTDANLVAGRLNPDYFLGGRIEVDVERAQAALGSLAGPLGVSAEEVALGVIRLANAHMLQLLKLVSVRRGRDPRDFSLIAFGGGGSMHACELARELRARRVIVPPAAGHFSAWGMLMSDLRHDLVQTRFDRLADLDGGRLAAGWIELETRLRRTLADEGVATSDVVLQRALDMRYAGQEHTVTVPVPDTLLEDGRRAELEQRFHELHERLYTFRLESPAEVVNYRLTGVGLVQKPELRRLVDGGDAEAAAKGTRLVDFGTGPRLEATLYERDRLGVGACVHGPAIVEETASTTVIFPGQRLTVDEIGDLIVEEQQS